MTGNDKNTLAYLIGFLAVFAAVLYIIDAARFSTRKTKKSTNNERVDAENLFGDWDRLRGDFVTVRRRELENYELQAN